MSALHRVIEINGIRMHVAEQGEGPLVLLCHGFPECWYSWRHQLEGLARAGFRAVAPDMRGYGETQAPRAVDQYNLLALVGDMVGLLDALRAEQAVIVGHDWGAPVAWHAALLRPDRFVGVVGLSVPFTPRGGSLPSSRMPQNDQAQFYQLYFQEEGVAEAEFERDVRASLRAILCSGFGEGLPAAAIGMVPRSGGFLSGLDGSSALPSWLKEDDLDVFVRAFERSGFRGGLNWYRNIDRNWELLAAWRGAEITVPALFMAGDRDPVMSFPGMDRVLAALPISVPTLRGSVILPGGHWIQQERAADVTTALIAFARGLNLR